ncbi:MAG: TIR domain-containing protein [Desulfarculus sp.]|nr:TIR domain-containing protein [Desulfarculus sp.]
MARRVFFSFHYQNDIWRVNQIRNSWVTQDRQAAGFWDAASWEQVKRQGDAAIKRWIDSEIQNTSVTVVLIGEQTAERRYVKYEIEKSHERKNGLLGLYIHNMRDQLLRTSIAGRNPFGNFQIVQTGVSLSQVYPTYDWVNNNGPANFANWIEQAARAAGR